MLPTFKYTFLSSYTFSGFLIAIALGSYDLFPQSTVGSRSSGKKVYNCVLILIPSLTHSFNLKTLTKNITLGVYVNYDIYTVEKRESQHFPCWEADIMAAVIQGNF